ncbi:MAG: polyprenyl synthetase family protein [Deltaproteobacteria bacterium]|nr:polyprenyl synthetase family protein [Deltaproteobacteria bacterium]
MNIKSYLEKKRERVNRALAGYLDFSPETPPRLKEAIQYSLEAGGKRIRSILAMASCEACGGEEEKVLPVACALEMIHTFSLIHDDLPAMDNDDLRRGRPTNHKVFGDGMAVLAGDGLLAHAFWLLAKTGTPAEVMEAIAWGTGPSGMVGGQALDLQAEGKKLNIQDLERIHRLKTGRLIAASVTSGARMANAAPGQLEGLQKYGQAVGLAFQIADDILNVEGSPKETGKQKTGSDQKRSKAAYPGLLGLEPSRTKANRLVEEAIASLSIFDDRGDPLREIARFIVARSH